MTKGATADAMAEGLSKLLGCEVTVVRERKPTTGYERSHLGAGPDKLAGYSIGVRKGKHFIRFPMGNHINTATRALAMVSDLIQMGFIETREP